MPTNRRKSKPLFKKKRISALRIVLIIVLILVLVFLGYSIGKPIMEFFSERAANGTPDGDSQTSGTPEASDTSHTTPPTATAPDETEPPISEEPEVIKTGILYVSFDTEADLTAQLDSAIQQATEENYLGICLDLLADGGMVMYNTANETAIKAGAVTPAPIDLDYCALAITEAGLLPYARISALSDNVASWFDRSLCYLFEDGSSKWLDNSLANGGKPWISPFSDSAKEYISSFVTEISEAGFVGIVAGEFEFPPFRNKDLGYVGAIVQDPERHTALTGFANHLGEVLGSAKQYCVEVNAEDILSGECEILSDTSALNCKTLYVKYNSASIGERVEKADGSIVSFEGLIEDYKIAQVYRLVNTELAGSGLKIVASVDSSLSAQGIYAALESIGYSIDNVIIY